MHNETEGTGWQEGLDIVLGGPYWSSIIETGGAGALYEHNEKREGVTGCIMNRHGDQTPCRNEVKEGMNKAEVFGHEVMDMVEEVCT